MNTAQAEKEQALTTADLASAAQRTDTQRGATRPAQEPQPEVRAQQAGESDEQLAPLFATDAAGDFRSRWDAVQIGFVDDPKQAVRQADELVARVMKSLADTFSNERARLDAQLEQGEGASTENLRVALRRYRSFFQRLLSL